MKRRDFIAGGLASIGALAFNIQDAQALWTPTRAECALFHYINEYRRENGVRPLLLSRSLGMAARSHAIYMAETDDVSHTLTGLGLTWSENILRFGYPEGYALGEVVAAGRSSAAGTLNQWKNSPGHNRAILNPNFRAMGPGRAVNPDGRYVYYWCVDLGGVRHRTIDC